MQIILGVLGVFLFMVITSSVRVLREYERGVVFRLGRFIGVKGPGLFFLIPFIDKMVKVSLRVVAMDVPPQDVITKDNVSIKVNAVLYFRVVNPEGAIVSVEDFLFATSQIAQTTLRSTVGEHELDQLLSDRESINQQLATIIDTRTDPWGVKVSAVEVKDVDLPVEMRRALARQAESERERRAKIIHAEGELQASEKLAAAAAIIGKEPTAIQLRYLSTLSEISSEQTRTLIFPLPMDLIGAFADRSKKES
ncbi:MAG: slipin family protein [Candidatus Eisenbacteria bacterium]|uniref:Slipin family protein n=1 Tax=Eiseniibacteriota bacterium TaxID=2212470 RepID=A0A7Y2EHA0_UNCEI|nr:slipin family protein [Candidatus Eisenbacteria bacterium]